MSKPCGWVPIDKSLVKTLKTLNRPYSEVEAMFSHTVDIDCGKPWTYRGYAKLWQWSVGKVQRFIDGMRNTSGTVVGRKGNGSGTEVHFIDKGLWTLDERLRNSSGTVAEHKQVATNNPNPNPNPNPKKNKKAFLSDSVEIRLSNLLFSKIKKRNPEHKQPDIQTWAKSIDLMLRIDKRDPQKIANVIDWCQKDFFWADNILSAAKLRAQYDALTLKMSSGKENKPSRADILAEELRNGTARN